MAEISRTSDSYDWFRVIEASCKRSIEENPERAGDFMQDGFLHCGVCKEAKREYFNFNNADILTSRDCKCVRDAKERVVKEKEYNERMTEIANLRGQSLMDDKFYEATFKNFTITEHNKSAYNACAKYCRCFQQMYDECQGLILYGPVGTGKSFLAGCIGNYLLSRLRPVMMTSFVKLLADSAKFNGMSYSELTERLMKPDLLILDDLGAERNTDFALERVYNIIDGRYRAKKPIILTTNLSLSDMKNTTDIRYLRIYDRVFEMCYPIKLDGPSWRRQEAKDRFSKMKAFFEGEDDGRR